MCASAPRTTSASPEGTTFSPFWDRAFLEFAGFTVGRARSFFDIFTYWGIYTNVRVDGDTDISGQNLWAYTAQLGNGFSATLSLEDPATHKAFTFDATAPGFFGLNGSVVNDNAFCDQCRRLRFPRARHHRQPARRPALGICRRQRRAARCQRRLLRYTQQHGERASRRQVWLGGRRRRQVQSSRGDAIGFNVA